MNYLFKRKALAQSLLVTLTALLTSQPALAAEPEIVSTPVIEVEQNSQYSYPLIGTDRDNDGLTWQIKDPKPSWLALIPNSKVTTVAGSGESGSDDNTDPLAATFNTLWGVAVDENGNVYTSEYYSYRIRQIALGNGDANNNQVSTVAGNGSQGSEDNTDALAASFSNLRHMAFHNNSLYIAGNSSNKIRQFNLNTGEVSTLAGSGLNANVDHQNPLFAQFDQPYGIAVDSSGNVFVSSANQIRKIDGSSKAVTTIAGNGQSAHVDNTDPLQASFSAASGLAIDSNNNIYIADGHAIRKIDSQSGAVSTLAGSTSPGSTDNSEPLQATFNSPLSLAVDSQNNLYVGDYANNKIRRIDSQTRAVTTYAGSGAEGALDNNDGQQASFNFPTALYIDSKDNLWVADWLNNKIRQVTPSATLFGQATNDQVGNHDVCLQLSDNTNTTEQCFTITVNNINDAPTISAEVITSTDEDSLYQLQVVGSDIDIDVGIDDSLTYQIRNKPTWATFNSSTGLLSGTPTNDDVGVTEQVTISVRDASAATATLAPFDLTVVNVNDAPIISGSPITSINEGENYLMVLSASDVDANDTLTFSIENGPQWLSLDTQNGVLQGVPSRADVGVVQNIVLSVSDGTATASLAPFDLEVLLVNDPPNIVQNQKLEGPEDTVLTGTIEAFDPQSDPISFSVTQAPTHGSVSFAGNIASYTPNSDFYGQDVFTIVASDGYGLSEPSQITVTVTPLDDEQVAINDVFVLSQDIPNEGYSLDVLANDNQNVQLVGAFSLQGNVIITDNQLTLMTAEQGIDTLSISYVIQDSQGKYATAQAVVVFE